ncbi:hypothetical protein [Methylobacterium mesophilicum]|uniref:hypothetical protein n=1 Tax=Methylobacterium mesophilicum TaxID=39956 RepID=UPI002F357D12
MVLAFRLDDPTPADPRRRWDALGQEARDACYDNTRAVADSAAQVARNTWLGARSASAVSREAGSCRSPATGFEIDRATSGEQLVEILPGADPDEERLGLTEPRGRAPSRHGRAVEAGSPFNPDPDFKTKQRRARTHATVITPRIKDFIDTMCRCAHAIPEM